MTQSRWRQRANEVIAQVVKETEGQPLKDRLRAISKAYPFGARNCHPYQIWLSAVKIARAEMEGKPVLPKGSVLRKPVDVEGQQKLFE